MKVCGQKMSPQVLKTVISLLVLLDSGVVVIVWYLDLQLTIQSVPITTNVVISAQVRCTRYNIM